MTNGGCVAKTYKGETIGIVCIPLSSNFKDCFNKLGLRHTVSLLDSFYLFFSDHIHRFTSAQCSSRAVESLKFHHRFYDSFNMTMIFLNHII